MAQSQDKEPTNQELIAALRAMMEGPIEKYGPRDRDGGAAMKSAMKRAFSEETYAKMLWRLRYPKNGRD